MDIGKRLVYNTRLVEIKQLDLLTIQLFDIQKKIVFRIDNPINLNSVHSLEFDQNIDVNSKGVRIPKLEIR